MTEVGIVVNGETVRGNETYGTSTQKRWEVNQSHYRPGQALRVPGGWGSQISRQSAHGGGKVVSPIHQLPLPSGNIPGTHFCKRLSRSPRAIVRPEGLCQWKNPKTKSRIEPATFRLVAQCLNQLRHRVLPTRILANTKLIYLKMQDLTLVP
jgi:hypothetical protein